jgi:hypothetical protein
MPDGTLVEGVIDHNGSAFARWYSGGSWLQWWAIGPGALDISVAAASVSSADTAYISVTFGGVPPNGGRGIYAFTANGGPAGTGL